MPRPLALLLVVTLLTPSGLPARSASAHGGRACNACSIRSGHHDCARCCRSRDTACALREDCGGGPQRANVAAGPTFHDVALTEHAAGTAALAPELVASASLAWRVPSRVPDTNEPPPKALATDS